MPHAEKGSVAAGSIQNSTVTTVTVINQNANDGGGHCSSANRNILGASSVIVAGWTG